MKRNQNFDHNHSQKVLSCRYNMDTNRVEARFEDGTTLSIDCIAIEDEYGNTPAQRAELDWLLYNKPLEYARLVLGAEILLNELNSIKKDVIVVITTHDERILSYGEEILYL